MNLTEFYKEHIDNFNIELKQFKRKASFIASLRLALFLLVATGIYLFWSNTPVVVAALLLGITGFIVLVSKYTDTKEHIKYLQKRIALNKLELRVIERDFSDLVTGTNYAFEEHPFNQDIDLFGEGSIFQVINRTVIDNGRHKLASWLNANDIEQIAEKQKAFKELSEEWDWRQNYTATASLIDAQTKEQNVDTNKILNWIRNYTPFVPKTFKWFPILFSILSIGVITTYFLGYITLLGLLTWLIIGLGITARYLKKVTELYNITSQIEERFSSILQTSQRN